MDRTDHGLIVARPVGNAPVTTTPARLGRGRNRSRPVVSQRAR